jgi:inosose dehydratase
MKFGCSLEMVNMRISEPGFKHKLSKSYWVELYQLIAAAGFKGIEMPYNPFMTDGIAFNMGRSGMPINRYSIETKYGSVRDFVELLRESGIEEITGVHVSANDAMIEVISTFRKPDELFGMIERAVMEAVEFLAECGGRNLVLSPTPEIGLADRHFGGKDGAYVSGFLARTAELVNRLGEAASSAGIRLSVRNEFWSLVRGGGIDKFLGQLDPRHVAYSPDIAHLAIADADPAEVVRRHRDRLSAVRFSDTFFQDVERNFEKPNPEIPVVGPQRVFCDLGDGRVDIAGVYRVLKESGYDEWVICESKKTLNVYKALLKLRWSIDHGFAKATRGA